MKALRRWMIGALCVLLLGGYAIGGTRGFARAVQNIRLRVRVMLEPPTPREIQRAAVRDSIDRQAVTAAVQRAREEMPAGRPASRWTMAALTGGIVIAALALMFITGRGK